MKRITFLFMIVCFIPLNTTFAEESIINHSSLTIAPLQSIGIVKVVASDEQKLIVNHNIFNQELLIECFINGFRFSKEKAGTKHQEGEGHLRLYIDGEHIGTLYEAAFVINGLPRGEHDIQIAVVKNDRTPYEMEETIHIRI
ncbi:hypothetical protein [Halalkalibacter nanhaiisediminis]|nr:hypothetical protein [Halalkalibacter nanhaiisediminis]